MRFWIIALVVGVALLLYFKPWRKKSKDYLNLTEKEINNINYLMGNFNMSYQEALDKTLLQRLEYKGSSGWS